jgi:hypothetical protein
MAAIVDWRYEMRLHLLLVVLLALALAAALSELTIGP